MRPKTSLCVSSFYDNVQANCLTGVLRSFLIFVQLGFLIGVSMRVAFLGLGIMGRPMASNLAKAGHEVTVWNRTPGKDVEGARTAASPAEAARGAEVIWLCVSDTKAVESILFGPQGVEEALSEGQIILDSSTIAPSATRRFAQRVAAKGVQYVDAPVTGSKIAAEAGTLIFIVGGEENAIEKLKPLFAATGKKIFRMGETGKGEAAKLVMNLQIALVYEGFAEALTLATKLGVDAETLLPLVEASMVRSTSPDAQRHPLGTRGRQGSAGEVARPGNGGGDLRHGRRRWARRSGLRRYSYTAREVGRGRS